MIIVTSDLEFPSLPMRLRAQMCADTRPFPPRLHSSTLYLLAASPQCDVYVIDIARLMIEWKRVLEISIKGYISQ